MHYFVLIDEEVHLMMKISEFNLKTNSIHDNPTPLTYVLLCSLSISILFEFNVPFEKLSNFH